jgi:hypothetical protein
MPLKDCPSLPPWVFPEGRERSQRAADVRQEKIRLRISLNRVMDDLRIQVILFHSQPIFFHKLSIYTQRRLGVIREKWLIGSS